ncbi:MULTISPECIES: hypothetical protein [unclassified Moraxella]|uniref:hypothetical protein n=1 Tax=unclassified Moraxella TaxID=2685852 RepID=UPI003AF79029
MSRSFKKSRTVYYKQAIVGKNQQLSDLLQQALLDENCKFPIPDNRHYKNNANSEDFYFLNEVSVLNGMIYGELIYIEKNKFQTIISFEDGVKRYPTRLVTVDDVNNTTETNLNQYQKEFIENTLYFGITGNHVAVIQSSSIRINRLSEYLNYLLGESGANLLGGNIILFKDMPSQQAKDIFREKPAKSVKLSQKIEASNEQQPKNITGFKSANFSFNNERSGLFNAVIQELGLDKKLSKKLKDNLQDDNLFIDITLRIKGKVSETSESGQTIIDTIATSLVNLDDEDFRVEYEGGGSLRGDEFRQTKIIKVETFDDGINHIQLRADLFQFLKENISDS